MSSVKLTFHCLQCFPLEVFDHSVYFLRKLSFGCLDRGSSRTPFLFSRSKLRFKLSKELNPKDYNIA